VRRGRGRCTRRSTGIVLRIFLSALGLGALGLAVALAVFVLSALGLGALALAVALAASPLSALGPGALVVHGGHRPTSSRLGLLVSVPIDDGLQSSSRLLFFVHALAFVRRQTGEQLIKRRDPVHEPEGFRLPRRERGALQIANRLHSHSAPFGDERVEHGRKLVHDLLTGRDRLVRDRCVRVPVSLARTGGDQLPAHAEFLVRGALLADRLNYPDRADEPALRAPNLVRSAR